MKSPKKEERNDLLKLEKQLERYPNDSELRLMCRKLRNKYSARDSRRRAKRKLQELELEVKMLKKRICDLERQNRELMREKILFQQTQLFIESCLN